MKRRVWCPGRSRDAHRSSAQGSSLPGTPVGEACGFGCLDRRQNTAWKWKDIISLHFVVLVCFPLGWKGGPLNPKQLTFRAGHFCCPDPLGQRLEEDSFQGEGPPRGNCSSSPAVPVHTQPQTRHTHHVLTHVRVCFLCRQGECILRQKNPRVVMRRSVCLSRSGSLRCCFLEHACCSIVPLDKEVSLAPLLGLAHTEFGCVLLEL